MSKPNETELRKNLKKAYEGYSLYKRHVESGGWYGDWTYQLEQMEIQTLEGLKKQVDYLMKKLGYDKWTNEDVEAEFTVTANDCEKASVAQLSEKR
jgi:hypothetical protein